jgi:mycofactocin precursor
MEASPLRSETPPATQAAPTSAPEPRPGGASAPAAPLLDLSHMEPPRRLKEARLEEVTIDGICGVY